MLSFPSSWSLPPLYKLRICCWGSLINGNVNDGRFVALGFNFYALECFLFLWFCNFLHDPCLLSLKLRIRYLCFLSWSTWSRTVCSWGPTRSCQPSLRISLCLWLLLSSWSFLLSLFDTVYNPLRPTIWNRLVLFLSIVFPRMSLWGLNSIFSLMVVMVFMSPLSFFRP